MKLRVLHLIERLSLGGASQSLLGITRHTKDDVFHVLVSLLPPDRTAFDLAIDAGIEVANSDHQSLLEEIEQADVVQIHFWNSPELYKVFELPWPASRIVLWCHVSGDHPPQFLLPEVVDRCDALIASSPHTASLPVFKTALKSKIAEVIIDTPDFCSFPKPEPVKQTHFTVVYVGTIDFIKMHPDFIQMHAKAEAPNLKVIVCGSGPALSCLKKQAAQSAVPERFEFTGFLTNPVQILSKADLFGYPLAKDNYATAELALQEAMYCGIPPLLIAKNGPALMLKDGETGILATSSRDYTEKLEALARSPESCQRIGTNAAKHAVKHWGSQRTAPQMHSLYQRVAELPRKTPRALKSHALFPGAFSFARSLGGAYPQFFQSLNSVNTNGSKAIEMAERRIAQSPPSLSSPSAGGILHYRFSYPSDPYLRYWSGLVLKEQGRTALAAMEFAEAQRLGLGADLPSDDAPPLEFVKTAMKDANILFCGNSVTAQKEGFRPILTEWLQMESSEKLSTTNTVLGGVGSFGCAYLIHSTLDRNLRRPSLSFIECLTGDIGIYASPDEIAPDLENVVRRLMHHGTFICFLGMYHQRRNTTDARELEARYQKIAKHYSIPFIDIAFNFDRLIDSGLASSISLLRDGIHTTPAGSFLASHLIIQKLQPLLKTIPPKCPKLPSRLFSTEKRYLYTIQLDPTQIRGIPNSHWKRFQLACQYVSLKHGEGLEIDLEEASLAGIMYINGPLSGGLRLVTSHSSHEYTLSDKWSYFERLHAFRLPVEFKHNDPICISPIGSDTQGNHASLSIASLLVRSSSRGQPNLRIRKIDI